MKNTLLLAGVAAFALSLAGGAMAAPDQMKSPQENALAKDTADGPDKAFIMKAANSGMFEIESSKIAVQRSKDAEVKKFAQQMITDHSKADAELKSIAGDKVPPKPDAATAARIEKLRAASDDGFDAAYIDEQKAAHDEAVGLFTTASEKSADPKLKAFAAKTLPTLKMHQEHVKGLNLKK